MNVPFSKWLRFKARWEKQYPGETLIKTGKDLKFCKEVLADVPDEIIDARMEVYFADEWYGENTHHSLAPFASNINTFIPKKRNLGLIVQIDCPICGKKHAPHKKCDDGAVVSMPKEFGETLTLLAKKMAAK